MSHTVKLENRVFNQLENFRDKRETYSQAVERLVDLAAGCRTLASFLERDAAYEQRKKEELEAAALSH